MGERGRARAEDEPGGSLPSDGARSRGATGLGAAAAAAAAFRPRAPTVNSSCESWPSWLRSHAWVVTDKADGVIELGGHTLERDCGRASVSAGRGRSSRARRVAAQQASGHPERWVALLAASTGNMSMLTRLEGLLDLTGTLRHKLKPKLALRLGLGLDVGVARLLHEVDEGETEAPVRG